MKERGALAGLQAARCIFPRRVQPRCCARDRPWSAKALSSSASRCFSATSRRRAEAQSLESAATERSVVPQLAHRIVPASPSYFTARPTFTDDLIAIQRLVNKHLTLPTVAAGEAPRVTWKDVEQYKSEVKEPVQKARYGRIIDILKRLNQIHPALMPDDVAQMIARFKRDINPFDNKPKAKVLDSWGRAVGVGRRKTSTARAWVVEGEGEVLVNGKSLPEAFGRLHHRESAIWALKATSRIDKYNVWALVSGGGQTGQAEALTLAVAKALLVHEPLLKPTLRKAGCITRDPRKVERKKPGHVKARKMPTWVKR